LRDKNEDDEKARQVLREAVAEENKNNKQSVILMLPKIETNRRLHSYSIGNVRSFLVPCSYYSTPASLR